LSDEAHTAELRGVIRRRFAEHFDRARRRGQETSGKSEQRRLAGTVRTYDPDDMTFGDAQRAVSERPAPPVALSQSFSLQDGGHALST
jgi:hypothetical protein